MTDPGLDIPMAEALLLVTGAATLPTRAAITASRTCWKKIVTGLTLALEREEPGHLYAIGVKATYWTRLSKFAPLYADGLDELERLAGIEVRTQFQALQIDAKAQLEARHPVTTVNTVLGARPVPSDELSEALFFLLADTVEDPMRVVHDLAAGVLAPDQILVFAEVFPETYISLCQMTQKLLSKRVGKDPDWQPPLWLADAIRVLWQQPLGTGVSVEVKAPPPSKAKAFKLDLDAFKAPVDVVT